MNQIKTNYYVEENQIIVARLTVTEFPNDWKEEMGLHGSIGWTPLDGDHAVIGERADEIVYEDLYQGHFDFGSLYYINRLDVHPNFRGEEIGIKLIKHTFKNLIRNAYGIAFLIAKPMKSVLSEDQIILNFESTGL